MMGSPEHKLNVQRDRRLGPVRRKQSSMRLMGFWVRVCQTGAAVHVPAVGGTGGLVVQEDVSSAVSPVARHLQAGTGDEEVSATHTHTHTSIELR